MGWITSSLFLCEIPDCQNPIEAEQTRQRGTCSLLPLQKQTLLPWNTCHLPLLCTFLLPPFRLFIFSYSPPAYLILFTVLSIWMFPVFLHQPRSLRAVSPLMFLCIVLHTACTSQVMGHVRKTATYLAIPPLTSLCFPEFLLDNFLHIASKHLQGRLLLKKFNSHSKLSTIYFYSILYSSTFQRESVFYYL